MDLLYAQPFPVGQRCYRILMLKLHDATAIRRALNRPHRYEYSLLIDAATFLRVHPEELRKRAKAGEFPAPKSAAPGFSSRTTLRTTCDRSMVPLGKRCK